MRNTRTYLTPERQDALDALMRRLTRAAAQDTCWSRRRCRAARQMCLPVGISQCLLDGGYCLDRTEG